MVNINNDPATGAGGVQEDCSEKTERPLNKPPKPLPQAASAWKRAAIETQLILRARFPQCFSRLDLPRRQPLKLKIHLDIAAALPELPAVDIARALRFYCNDIRYRRDCTEGKIRFDLAGQPAGVVTADEARHCQKSVAGILAKRRKSRSSSQPSATLSPPTPPPRLTLAALREAAAKRKLLETSGA
jgi:sRNA-binding protein